jgi:hypothetical protein
LRQATGKAEIVSPSENETRRAEDEARRATDAYLDKSRSTLAAAEEIHERLRQSAERARRATAEIHELTEQRKTPPQPKKRWWRLR